MSRRKTPRDKALIAMRNGHRPAAVVQRLVDGTGGVSFDDANDAYRSSMDASDPSNRFMRRRNGLGGSGDYHTPETRLWQVRETSRHMAINDDLIGQSIARLADNIVQDSGFRLVVNTGDDVLDAEIEALHAAWADDPKRCDFFAERTFAQLQWMVQYQQDQDGDMFAIGVDDGTVQLTEADRCTSVGQPISDAEALGLLFDASGKVTAYRFSDKPLGPFQTRTTGPTRVVQRFDADGFEQVMHCFAARRVTQHRGMPLLTPVMVKAGMLDDLQFAMVVKAQSAAAHAVLLKQSADSKLTAPPRTGVRSTGTTTAADGSAQTVYTDSVRYGQVTTLPKGVEPVFTQPLPSTEQLAHVRATIQQMGAAMGLPVELVLLDASNTNYSGWRGAMDAARMGFRRRQKDLIAQFLCPTHRLNVRRWAYGLGRVARAKLADGSLFGHRWVPASWPYINPKDDAEAAQILMRSGQDSPRGIVAKRGESYDDIVRETVTDRAKAIRLALAECDAIETDTGYQVSPFVLLGWDLPANSALITSADEMANAGDPAPPSPTSTPPAPAADNTTTHDSGPDDPAPGASTIPARNARTRRNGVAKLGGKPGRGYTRDVSPKP